MVTRFTVKPNVGWDIERIFIQEFTDHAGNKAFRYGAPLHDENNDNYEVNEGHDEDFKTQDGMPWPPTNYATDQYFCFQVYITFSNLELNPKVCQTLALHLMNLWECEYKLPLWEFYIGPRSVLDCIDHSRHEIAHRKTMGKEVPRIHPLQHNVDDERLLAFAFIIDNERGWHIPLQGSQSDEHHFPDHTGPLWAQFDSRISSAVTRIDDRLLLQTSYTADFNDQLDYEIMRIQGIEAEGDMMAMYSSSFLAMNEEQDLEEDFLEDNSDQLESDYVVVDSDVSSNGQLNVIKHAGITVTNTQDVAALQYVIFTTFASDLEHVARTFAAAVASITTRSYRFDFYLAASDADALAAYSSISGSLAPRSLARRVPHGVPNAMYFQDPITPNNPFKTCFILIDRPDFLHVPAVRFLLSAGSPQMTEENNFMMIASLRSPNMKAVVDRIIFETDNPKDKPWFNMAS